MSNAIQPQVGTLVDLYRHDTELNSAKRGAAVLPEWVLSHRQIAELELLVNGAFSPLTGYMTRADYDSVLERGRLADGVLWPLPIVLDVTEAFARGIQSATTIALRNEEGLLIATLDISDIWRPDKKREAEALFPTSNPEHPGVTLLMDGTHDVYFGGQVRGFTPPPHYAFTPRWHTPARLRDEFEQRKWNRVIAFPTRRILHRAEIAQATHAAHACRANLVIHAAVCGEPAGPFDDFARIRCYEAALDTLPEVTTLLSLCALPTRSAGPRQALLEAIVRRNYGFSHLIVPRDFGSPERSPQSPVWYTADAAQVQLRNHEAELGIAIVPVDDMVYVPDRAEFLPRGDVEKHLITVDLPADEVVRRLDRNLEIPSWFSYPSVMAQLRGARPPRHRQGFTVFFTGLSGSGKSTLAQALMQKLKEIGGRTVSLLDGDIVRRNLSSELGFSKAHRDLNIRRIGFVAGEITRAGGIAICAPIAPYTTVRRIVRAMVEPVGGFLEVYVSTPLAICEARDRKGLYAKARQGLIKEFTGISDPYEPPERPELEIDTANVTPSEAVNHIFLILEQLGYIQ